MEKFKQIVGITFLIFGFFGILVCLSYMFNLNLFKEDSDIFGRGYDGASSSNSPAFFGLIAIAGSLLLLKSKNHEGKV